jgi:hypothetical protein
MIWQHTIESQAYESTSKKGRQSTRKQGTQPFSFGVAVFNQRVP